MSEQTEAAKLKGLIMTMNGNDDIDNTNNDKSNNTILITVIICDTYKSKSNKSVGRLGKNHPNISRCRQPVVACTPALTCTAVPRDRIGLLLKRGQRH